MHIVLQMQYNIIMYYLVSLFYLEWLLLLRFSAKCNLYTLLEFLYLQQ